MQCKGYNANSTRCRKPALENSDYCAYHQDGQILMTQQCEARTRRGQCKLKTRKGRYCHFHHEKIEGVKIKKSTISNAGLGLFALKDFPKGSAIVPYTGDIVVTDDPDYGNSYALQIKRNTYIDARKTTSGTGRFSNSCKSRDIIDGRKCINNANLVYDRRAQTANIKAKKNIKKGQEILTSYGRSYW